MISRLRCQQMLAVVSAVAALQVLFASHNPSLEHQEGTVAGCNTVSSIMAVLYTIMAAGILTGWLHKFSYTPEQWHLALCVSSFWMGALYIQSAVVSHGYISQALVSEAMRLWTAGDTAALRASYILADVLAVAYIVFGVLLLQLKPVSPTAQYEPLEGNF